MAQHPIDTLKHEAHQAGLDLASLDFAAHLDNSDELKHLRAEFHIPTHPAPTAANATALPSTATSSPVIYLCGNSLGLQPKRTAGLLTEELQVWAERGVHGHFDHAHGRPWVTIDETVTTSLERLVGAAPGEHEVACMGSLTNNLHLLMVAFYRPTAARYKIVIEAKAFPSDTYAVASQVAMHGRDPADAVIALAPRTGEYTLRTEDILKAIDDNADQIALVMLSGLQYYTGQAFEMERITAHAKAKGCVVGWDLAHAVGNLDLKLHDWGVDFAAWCSYKYLNSGPGCIAGAFVHSAHATRTDLPRLAGWWGHDKASRFTMPADFRPMPGAAGFQLSNPSVVATVCVLGSMQVYDQTTMAALRAKSDRLTAYLEHLLDMELHDRVRDGRLVQLTPRDVAHRGAQLSLLFPAMTSVAPLMRELEHRGVVVDEREPNVIRVAPAPLYNTFSDVRRFVTALKSAMVVVSQ
ncbi:kynureninase-like protein [Blastocladiella britannica]|nr:kynureninase-like protein [Blastocladiella britannica]